MDWVASNAQKPAVASMSLGGPKSTAENYAVRTMNQAGITVVVAAGNENTDACTKSPASAANAITVGSTQQRGDRRSSFSNYGSCLKIFAPGSDILSASHRSDSSGVTQSGTSMACPHVAGAAAVILGSNPSFLPDQVKEQLLSTATKGVVSDHRSGSANLLLYVDPNGGKSSPTPAPTDAGKGCVCSGAKTSDGKGGPSCPSTTSNGPYCYTAPGACADGKASSIVTGAEYSNLACGSAASPTPSPTPKAGGCPSTAKYSSPDKYGDCECAAGTTCYSRGSRGLSRGCPYSRAGYKHTRYFSPTCDKCKCYR